MSGLADGLPFQGAKFYPSCGRPSTPFRPIFVRIGGRPALLLTGVLYVATENQLGEFLREIREVILVHKHNEEQEARLREERETRSDAGSVGEKTKPAALDIGLAAAASVKAGAV